MTLPVALFIFGAILFLIGLVGKVKTAEIDIGSNSIIVRGISLLLGIFLMFQAFRYLPSENDTPIPKEIPESKTDSKKKELEIKGQATLEFWNKQRKLDLQITSKINSGQEQIAIYEQIILEIKGLDNLISLGKQFLSESKKIPIKNVDPELAEIFLRMYEIYDRVLSNHYRRHTILKEIENLYLMKKKFVIDENQLEFNLNKLKPKIRFLQDKSQSVSQEFYEDMKTLDLLRIKLTSSHP
jgi:hypothetical protein